MIQLHLLTKRQQFILNFVQQHERATNQEILSQISEKQDHVSRVTLIRDLNGLLEKKLLQKKGKGRGVWYESTQEALLKVFAPETYFEEGPDQRLIHDQKLEFVATEGWSSVFSTDELRVIDKLTKDYQDRTSKRSSEILEKEFERVTIEFSWKSSRIEGNTYSLLDTERLLKLHEEAKGKTHEEAVMILNHKTALNYVQQDPEGFKILTLKNIQDIHALIAKDLGIGKGFRHHSVGIVGTKYQPSDNIYQIKEGAERLCHLINSVPHPFLKSCLAVVGISYLQPFADGNKRTSRIIGNSLLMAHHFCPLSYRSVDEILYKKAMILFYEQHSLSMFKELFLEQYHFAVKNYFL